VPPSTEKANSFAAVPTPPLEIVPEAVAVEIESPATNSVPAPLDNCRARS
jgi:hypothetical protein